MSDVLGERPSFHGTRADLRGWAAEPAAGNGARRVYAIEPTGAFENDANMTAKKLPGNPTPVLREQGTNPDRRRGGRLDMANPEALRQGAPRLSALHPDERGDIIN